MSVLNKIPYISALLNSLSAEELQTLLTLMNGGGNRTPIHRTANPIADANVPHISPSDKGVKMCDLTINYTNFVGYLVYTDDCCALISYTDSPVLKVFDIDVPNVGIATVDEAINVLELRTVVWETIHKNGSGGGTEVIANPELEGDENALNSIEINGVKYKVEGGDTPSVSGGGLYKHSMSFHYSDMDITSDITIELVNNKADTYADLTAMIADFQTRPCVSKRLILSDSGTPLASIYFDNIIVDIQNGITYLYFAYGQADQDPEPSMVGIWKIEMQYITTTPTDTVEVYSAGGGSQPATGPTYCYVQVSSGPVSHNIIYMFDRRSADRQDMVDGVNLLITTLNSMFSVSIPSYSSIDDLPTIADYINSLDTTNYGTLKVIWWASLFNSFQYLSLSVKLYFAGWVLPALIFARSDQSNNQYSYAISYLDDINQLQSLWTSSDTFDFSIHVDDLD